MSLTGEEGGGARSLLKNALSVAVKRALAASKV
jgi:hypothetical protein